MPDSTSHIRRTLVGLPDDHEDITAGDLRGLLEQLEAAQADLRYWRKNSKHLSEQLEAALEREEEALASQDYWRYANLKEQKEAADRVLAVADQLAEWVRVTVSVEGVFSNNLGAQAQAQGLANLLTRYAAARDSFPANEPEEA